MLTSIFDDPDNRQVPTIGAGNGAHDIMADPTMETPGDECPDGSGCAPMAKRIKTRDAAEFQFDAPADPFSLQTVYCGDNLDKLSRMPSKCVDLIYIDPPFNSNRNYEVFWGEAKETRRFEDRHASTEAYIKFMQPRCVELRRVLKDTGSFYYHCDWHASHYVKVMLDQVFDERGFRSDIIWKRASTVKGNAGQGSKLWGTNTDNILFYTKSDDYNFNPQFSEYSEDYLKKFYKYAEPKSGRRYRLISMIGPGGAAKGNPRYEVMGVTRYWRYSHEKMGQLIADGMVVQTKPGTVPVRKQYLDQGKGVAIQTLWDDIEALSPSARERTGYPTQKPLPLLERIIKASSNPDDIVLDAFCGCGTALEAAQRLDRRWIGIDISPTACRVMSNRLKRECLLTEGRDFFVRDLPKTAEQLRKYPHYEFENWAVNALNTVVVNGKAIGNKVKVGDMGIDGRIYPIRADKTKTGGFDLFGPTDDWLPIQVKQEDSVGRPQIDEFYAAMKRQKRDKGFFISFGFSSGALKEMKRLHDDPQDGLEIIPLTVDEILAEEVRYRV